MSDASPPAAASAAKEEGAFSLVHHFLIAMPGMADPSFSGAVVYICEHSSDGALGLVINRPIDRTFESLFERLSLKLERADLTDRPVLFGGPVQTDRGFVLHDDTSSHYDSTLVVRDGLALTMSKDVLEAVVEGAGPKRLLITLGHAGWGGGQLEQELSANAWLTVEADAAIVFDVPLEQRFGAAMHLLGVDPAMLSDQAGHA
jgi:putative transcriptional regulator